MKRRKKIAVKSIFEFTDDHKTVRCWYDLKEKEICFRRNRSRRVFRVGVRDLWSKVQGQILMPFV